MREHYSAVEADQLILRDHLPIDRTVLANERTLLAYVRTALALFVSGVTFIKFFDSRLMEAIGWAFIPMGVGLGVFSAYRYVRMHAMITGVYSRQRQAPEPPSGAER